MRRGGRDQGFLRNPVLIGALTVLVVVVTVTLAYQADNGLPFVPKYSLHVQVRDAQELTHGGEVHMGGALIGLVTSVDPGRDPAGQPIAILNLSLDKKVEPLPVDSTFIIRLKGAIGLKFLDVTRGHASSTYANGATVPLERSGATVDLDQLLSIFNPPTRKGVARATTGFSDALTGRGGGINDAIGAFVPLVRDLGPVMRNLGSSKTDVGGFFHGLERVSAALAPVARAQASAVHQPRHHVPRARGRRGPVSTGVDLRYAAGFRHGDRRQPSRAVVPVRRRRAVRRPATRVRHATQECARTR